MYCGRKYSLGEYINDIDPETWEKISTRACNRA
jgi:hypothetical protein